MRLRDSNPSLLAPAGLEERVALLPLPEGSPAHALVQPQVHRLRPARRLGVLVTVSIRHARVLKGTVSRDFL